MTPFEPFKSKASTTTEADPLGSASRIPRAARVPADLSSAIPRDTEPAELFSDSEKTPVESPYGLKAISLKLDQVLECSQAAANEAIATRSEVRALTDKLEALAKRVLALEVSSRWAPLLLSSVALLGLGWTLFQLQHLQIQIETIIRH